MNQIVLIMLRGLYVIVVMTFLIVLLGRLTMHHIPISVFLTIAIPVTSIVWIPRFGLSGTAGYLCKSLAEAIIIAMVASFILSRTLVPTMAKYMMRGPPDAKSPRPADA